MRDLVSRHRVRLVYPVPRDRWIVKMAQTTGDDVTRRRSPKHPSAIDVFSELVSFPELIGHQNFELDVVLIEEETVWRFDSPKALETARMGHGRAPFAQGLRDRVAARPR